MYRSSREHAKVHFASSKCPRCGRGRADATRGVGRSAARLAITQTGRSRCAHRTQIVTHGAAARASPERRRQHRRPADGSQPAVVHDGGLSRARRPAGISANARECGGSAAESTTLQVPRAQKHGDGPGNGPPSARWVLCMVTGRATCAFTLVLANEGRYMGAVLHARGEASRPASAATSSDVGVKGAGRSWNRPSAMRTTSRRGFRAARGARPRRSWSGSFDPVAAVTSRRGRWSAR